MRKEILTGIGAMALGVLALAQMGKGAGNQSPSYQGSIPVQEAEGNEATEAQAYQALAKVTPDQAVKAAQAYLGTSEKPTRVSLGNENGYLVWEVVLAGQEVKVDAGTGQVLHKEAYGAEHEEGGAEHEEGGAEEAGE
ncbi:PepSY domain-containing protein [Thermus sp.]|jgi:uncharacterized protein YpmB|uniref:PepSY domain-containing protein n=1 Tax=Thermus sp. TaxID=275 RepID=UPI003D0B4E04